jgi:hypothetical protein
MLKRIDQFAFQMQDVGWTLNNWVHHCHNLFLACDRAFNFPKIRLGNHHGRGCHCGISGVEADHGFQAIVMTFKNQIATNPGEQNKSFPDVTANLTFKGTDRTEDIDYGTWLNQYTRSVRFKPGEVRHLVIAWFERGRKRLMGFYNPKSTNPLKGRWHSNIELHEPEQRVLPMSPCEVTVQLISHNTTLFTERYVLTATEDGTMELKKHDPTAVQPQSS